MVSAMTMRSFSRVSGTLQRIQKVADFRGLKACSQKEEGFVKTLPASSVSA